MAATEGTYEVRYPDGDTVLVRAYLIYYYGEKAITLLGGPPGPDRYTAFIAPLSANVTIRRLPE